MRNLTKLALAATAMTMAAAPAAAVTINFDNLAVGTILSTQYAGVTFTANGLTGANTNSTTQGWATNTDMTIVSATGSDVGALGTPSLVSGNVLHSLNGWAGENGDPSFRISFAAPITAISMAFAGVSGPLAGDTALYIFNGATQIGFVNGTVGTGTQQFTLSFNAASITSVVVAPGSFADWAAIDNINYTPAATAVPEPASWAMLIGGFGLVGGAMRRRSANLRTSVRFA